MKLLVTGGLGFIGSHTVVELIEKGHEVTIVDNLYNSKIEVLDKIEKITKVRPAFYQKDILILEDLRKIFAENKFDGVIHFAGLKAVAESVKLPILYYDNNLIGTINLLKCMQENEVFKFVFSSSACVYGEPDKNPITEDQPNNRPVNPYGRTKFFVEEMLKDLSASDNRFKISILRYFNPIGAHPSGLIGEDPNDIPNNLMPFILKVANKELDVLKIYGNDYKTKDGTCRRDFIHVVDLAKGHVSAIENIDNTNIQIINLGTGKSTSVLEIVKAFNKVNNNLVAFEYAERRPGDVAEYYACPDKAEKELGWTAKLDIERMCIDAWNFIKSKNK